MLYLKLPETLPAKNFHQPQLGVPVFISYFIYHMLLYSANYWHSVDNVLLSAQNALNIIFSFVYNYRISLLPRKLNYIKAHKMCLKIYN